MSEGAETGGAGVVGAGSGGTMIKAEVVWTVIVVGTLAASVVMVWVVDVTVGSDAGMAPYFMG